MGSLRKGVFSLRDARQPDVCSRTAFLKLPNKQKKLFTQSRIFLLIVVDGGNAINKILFLKVRAMKKDAATLVASGPQGNVPGGGGYSWEFLVGVCRPVLQILTLFQTKNVIFHIRFQTRARLLKTFLR